VRVLCCFSGRIPEGGPYDINQHGLYPSAIRALQAYAPGFELVDVSGDDYAYWGQIRARWTGEKDLVLVEQDVEITADVLPGFIGCPSPWCTFRYRYWRTWPPSADACGCTRYSARLQREIPARVIEAGWGTCGACCGPDGRPGYGSPPRPGCWRHVDAAILTAFQEAGFKQSCRHESPLLAHRKEAALASQRA
jgi:hypothetical protein